MSLILRPAASSSTCPASYEQSVLAVVVDQVWLGEQLALAFAHPRRHRPLVLVAGQEVVRDRGGARYPPTASHCGPHCSPERGQREPSTGTRGRRATRRTRSRRTGSRTRSFCPRRPRCSPSPAGPALTGLRTRRAAVPAVWASRGGCSRASSPLTGGGLMRGRADGRRRGARRSERRPRARRSPGLPRGQLPLLAWPRGRRRHARRGTRLGRACR